MPWQFGLDCDVFKKQFVLLLQRNLLFIKNIPCLKKIRTHNRWVVGRGRCPMSYLGNWELWNLDLVYFGIPSYDVTHWFTEIHSTVLNRICHCFAPVSPMGRKVVATLHSANMILCLDICSKCTFKAFDRKYVQRTPFLIKAKLLSFISLLDTWISLGLGLKGWLILVVVCSF